MTNARRDGQYLLIIGCALFVLLGLALEARSSSAMTDVKAIYAAARCLVKHQDPYQVGNYLSIYRGEGGPGEHDNPGDAIMTLYPYPPTTFCITVPLALLPWGVVHVFWLIFTAGSLIFASLLIWNVGAEYAPVISGCLICLFLANSELVLILGNAAGIAVSLCVIAAWCFIRRRFEFAGIACLAIGLLLKPHVTGLIWCYFLLAGGTYRKRSLQTLVLAIALFVPVIGWLTYVAPHWMQELNSNVSALSMRGEINDPGPHSGGGHDLGMIIDLQEAISFFRDEPQFYNPATYIVCGALLLIWSFHALKARPAPGREWLGLAAIAALSLLPVYHRQYDARLLLFTIPACVQLVAEGGVVSIIALFVTTTGVLITGELFWALYLEVLGKTDLGLSQRWFEALQVFPIPVILLVVAVFYLWVFARRAHVSLPKPTSEEAPKHTLIA